MTPLWAILKNRRKSKMSTSDGKNTSADTTMDTNEVVEAEALTLEKSHQHGKTSDSSADAIVVATPKKTKALSNASSTIVKKSSPSVEKKKSSSTINTTIKAKSVAGGKKGKITHESRLIDDGSDESVAGTDDATAAKKRKPKKKVITNKHVLKKNTIHGVIKNILVSLGEKESELRVSEKFVVTLEDIIRERTLGLISLSNHLQKYKGLCTTDGNAIKESLEIISHIKQFPTVLELMN